MIAKAMMLVARWHGVSRWIDRWVEAYLRARVCGEEPSRSRLPVATSGGAVPGGLVSRTLESSGFGAVVVGR